MLINCRNIKKLPHMENLKIVAGEEGLDKVIKWFHYMENPGYVDWLKGGELILITGILLGKAPDKIIELIEKLNEKKAAGLVINVGPYIDATPEEVINFANTIKFPIFELPFEVKIIDFSQSICKAVFNSKVERESMDSFFKDIMFSHISCNEEILNRAVGYGYKPEAEYCSFVVYLDNFNSLIGIGELWDEQEESRLKEQVEQIITKAAEKFNKKPIYVCQSNSIIVLFTVTEKDRQKNIDLLAEDVIEEIEVKLPKVQVSIGIGTIWKKLQDLKESVAGAQKALRVLKLKGGKKKIYKYEDMGVYRLLFELEKNEELKLMYKETLGKLIEYDNKNSTELVTTLECYINEDCNLIRTSEALFIHKNTLKYRIRRIEEILNCDFKNIEQIVSFSIAIKIGRLLS